MPIGGSGNGHLHPSTQHSDNATPISRSLQAPDATAIERWLTAQIADLQGITPGEVDLGEPFESFGLSSRELVALSGDMEEWLDRKLSPTLLYEHPTIQALARHLAEPLGAQPEAGSASQPAAGRATTRHEPIAIIGIGCRF